LRADTIINKKLCIDAAGNQDGACADKKTRKRRNYRRPMAAPAGKHNAAITIIS
jgi:hypothetical protein